MDVINIDAEQINEKWMRQKIGAPTQTKDINDDDTPIIREFKTRA